MAQYGEYQLEGSQDKRICVGLGKREENYFKNNVRKSDIRNYNK